MTFKRGVVAVITIAIMFIIQSCNGDNSSDPIILNSYTGEESFEFSSEEAATIRINNKVGGIIVSGWSDSSSIRVYLYKTMEAISQEVADQHLGNIFFSGTKNNDELDVELENPNNTDELVYKSTSLSLEIPYYMNCEIGVAHGPIHISQLNGSINIENTEHAVEILNHVGACNVKSSNNISAIVALPDSMHCQLSTTSGDIILKIPKETNARINLRSTNGTVTYSDFDFTELDHDGKNMEAVLGNGSAQISLESGDGNVRLEMLQ